VVAIAETESAKAAVATARSTERNATYMLASVAAAAVSAMITAAGIVFNLLNYHAS
jgi:hypothetical protein